MLLAGGDCKGADFSAFTSVLQSCARGVVLIGRDAERIAAAVPESVPSVRARTMDDAVARAAAMALPGDRVLLSPACASFDMFTNYAQRGERFVQAVRRLAA